MFLMVRRAELAELVLPEFGYPSNQPKLSKVLFQNRLIKLREKSQGVFDYILVYGDREHMANISYLTGYDPRFEEALFIVDIDGDKQWILVGNEGIGYLETSPIRENICPILYQPFSLLSQDRSKSKPLKQIFNDVGINQNNSIGIAGWKYFTNEETPKPEKWIESPSYIVDTVRSITSEVANATQIFMHQTEGLRVINEPEQLALMEYAATLTSQAVRNVIFGIKPNLSEHQAAQLMNLNGYPHSVHTMLSTGTRAWIGLPSPSDKIIQKGEAFTVAVGLWGALNCRAGWLLEHESELPSKISDYLEKLAKPYFEASVSWLETVRINISGHELYRSVHDIIGDSFYGVKLNPGHQIGLDEWVNSPIYEKSTDRIKSGMALQLDIIPATGSEYFTINIEDGLAIADKKIINHFTEYFPEAWERIIKRRDYMTDCLGIKLQPEVLPFSNLAGHLPPFILNPNRAFRMVER
jgi:Xaa-Pro aminopeptidase